MLCAFLVLQLCNFGGVVVSYGVPSAHTGINTYELETVAVPFLCMLPHKDHTYVRSGSRGAQIQVVFFTEPP